MERVLLLGLKASGESEIPFIWFWPAGKQGCAMMTHDVETSRGLEFCPELMDLNDSFEIKSAFQLIPGARYEATQETIEEFRKRGFEVNLHDWNHDGHLYSDRMVFLQRAAKINHFATQHGIEGFRSGVLYRNAEWYDAFSFAYDMSVPNVGHLDPQPGGCCTVMPYFIGGILELPLTTIQDYSLWHILNDYTIDVWKRQLDMVLEAHGLASFLVHPDYVIEKEARKTYKSLLEHLCSIRLKQNVWIARPQEVNHWWRQRSQMNLVRRGSTWQIDGSGSKRACVAYAMRSGEQLVYRVEQGAPSVSS
jgi:peptidoglycan/xylan/chitin deacetylase (PgdA/CDA1 family)